MCEINLFGTYIIGKQVEETRRLIFATQAVRGQKGKNRNNQGGIKE